MRLALIDTDILSLFFRGDPNVVTRIQAYTSEHGQINFSIITYYEILSGLKHRDAQKQLDTFLRFASENNVIPLTEQAATLSAEMYASTRASGTPVADIDILIAGIAKANNWVLVTHNTKHFEKIKGPDIEDWSETQ